MISSFSTITHMKKRKNELLQQSESVPELKSGMYLKKLVAHTNRPKKGITSIMREYENIIYWIYEYEQHNI